MRAPSRANALGFGTALVRLQHASLSLFRSAKDSSSIGAAECFWNQRSPIIIHSGASIGRSRELSTVAWALPEPAEAMTARVRLALLLSAVLASTNAPRVASRGPGMAVADFRAAATRTAPQCSLAAGSGSLAPGARYRVDLMSGGKARTFIVRLPDAPTSSMPVLLAVHGALQSATIFLDVAGAARIDLMLHATRMLHSAAPALVCCELLRLVGSADVPSADGASPEVAIDSKAAAKGFVTIAPNALCDAPLQLSTCRWAETTTTLDPGWAADQTFPQQSEMRFFADAVACVKTVLGVSLGGDVFALGFSQGAKLVSRFGCAGAAVSGGELRLRGVVAAEGFFADEVAYATCGAAVSRGDVTPPPMLLFQAQQDATVPYCTPGAPYIQSAEYFNRWAAAYARCRQTVPFGQQVLANSPAIMQARLCTMRAAVPGFFTALLSTRRARLCVRMAAAA